MKTPLAFFAAAAAAILPAHALAARVQDAQQVMGLDLNACPRPAYPAAALAQRAGGKTTVEVQIGAHGLVTEARVAVPSGRTDLDEAALDGIRGCIFHAVLATGQAPTGWLKMQYVWIPGEAKKVQAPVSFADTQKRADAGDPAAQSRLGDMYMRGSGVARDRAQALRWYEQAAAQGNAQAMLNLVALQPIDSDSARYWLTRAADSGLADAQLLLGMFVMRHAASDEDRTAAAAWIARAAAQDNAQAQYYLGRSFELGLGNAPDAERAAGLYRKTLERSNGRGETALGILTEAGSRDKAADQDEAAKLYQKAMRWRYPPAFYRYGLVLEQRGDTDLAAAVFLQGAQLGDCGAVAKYVQLKQVAGTTPAAGTLDAYWRQRAQGCAARPALPQQL